MTILPLTTLHGSSSWEDEATRRGIEKLREIETKQHRYRPPQQKTNFLEKESRPW